MLAEIKKDLDEVMYPPNYTLQIKIKKQHKKIF